MADNNIVSEWLLFKATWAMFSYIIQWNDDEICFVLDQNA